MLEVSHQHPQLRPGTRIGVWCATKLATDAGGWRQINRAGHPMMWPIFWPDDTDFSNPANTRHPSQDFNAVGKYIGDKVSAVVAASGTSGPQLLWPELSPSCPYRLPPPPKPHPSPRRPPNSSRINTSLPPFPHSPSP